MFRRRGLRARSTPGRADRHGTIHVGILDVANMVSTIADALRSVHRPVYSFVIKAPGRAFYDENRHDGEIRRPEGLGARILFQIRLARRLVSAARTCDMFVYVYSVGFLPLQLDLLFLRSLGKHVVVFFCGDDIRYRPIQMHLDRILTSAPPHPLDAQELALYASGTEGGRFWRSFWATKLAEKTGCRIVAARDSATFQAKPYAPFRFPQQQLIREPKRARRCPLVVHAPSNRLVKGTSYVLEAMAMLKRESVEFEFELISDRPNAYVRQRLIDADIVVDQPGVWIGRLAAEGLSSGCVVVGGNQTHFGFSEDDSPVVQFDRDAGALATTLRTLITDHERRERLMRASFGYALRNFSYDAFVRYVDDVLEGRAATLHPLPGQRETVRLHARTPFQRMMIRLFW